MSRQTKIPQEKLLTIVSKMAATPTGVTLKEIQTKALCSYAKATTLIADLSLVCLGQRQGARGRPSSVYGLEGAPIPSDLTECPTCGQQVESE